MKFQAAYLLQVVAAVDSAADKKTASNSAFSAKPQRSMAMSASPSDEACWTSMLMQIPGFSETTARVVAAQYPSPSLFLLALASNTDLEQQLADLQLAANGTRRLGPAKARLLVNIFSQQDAVADIRF